MRSLTTPFIGLSAGMLLMAPWIINAAPYESTMGLVQKVFYFHFPSAILFLTASVICGVHSFRFLFMKRQSADAWALSAAELNYLKHRQLGSKDAAVRRQQCLFQHARLRIRCGVRDQQDFVCLAQAAARPRRIGAIRLEDDELMRRFLLVEPRREANAGRLLAGQPGATATQPAASRRYLNEETTGLASDVWHRLWISANS
jgi:hypothetical protein